MIHVQRVGEVWPHCWGCWVIHALARNLTPNPNKSNPEPRTLQLQGPSPATGSAMTSTDQKRPAGCAHCWCKSLPALTSGLPDVHLTRPAVGCRALVLSVATSSESNSSES